MSRAERVVSRILLLGGLLAVILMVAGLMELEMRATTAGRPLDMAHIADNRAADVFVSLPQIARGLHGWPPVPAAVIAAGIVVLQATPAIAVIGALAAFAGAGDRRYVLICAALIGALACGLFLNVGG